jgi:hypothetical protein
MNSRSRATRLRKLGWQPREKGWEQGLLEDEIPAVLQEKGGLDKSSTFNHVK